ncbi:hypothetical protein J2Y91_000507 [Erwinia aphidicola]|nr:hypothetical protein [Erwinia aphidicola]
MKGGKERVYIQVNPPSYTGSFGKGDRPLRYESSQIFLASSLFKTHSGHAVSRDEACRR